MYLLKQQLQGNRGSTRSIVLRQFGLFVMFAFAVAIMIAIAFKPEPAEDKFDRIADADLESVLAPAAGGNGPAEASESNKGISLRESMKQRMRKAR